MHDQLPTWSSCYVDTLKVISLLIHTHHSVSSFCHKTPMVNRCSRGECEHPFPFLSSSLTVYLYISTISFFQCSFSLQRQSLRPHQWKRTRPRSCAHFCSQRSPLPHLHSSFSIQGATATSAKCASGDLVLQGYQITGDLVFRGYQITGGTKSPWQRYWAHVIRFLSREDNIVCMVSCPIVFAAVMVNNRWAG